MEIEKSMSRVGRNHLAALTLICAVGASALSRQRPINVQPFLSINQEISQIANVGKIRND
jgi:hypothetical protein